MSSPFRCFPSPRRVKTRFAPTPPARRANTRFAPTQMPELQFRDALRTAMTEEMERDPNVFLMGEEVAQYNGAYKVSQGMLDRFGPGRVIDTPISEAAFSGLGI